MNAIEYDRVLDREDSVRSMMDAAGRMLRVLASLLIVLVVASVIVFIVYGIYRIANSRTYERAAYLEGRWGLSHEDALTLARSE